MTIFSAKSPIDRFGGKKPKIRRGARSKPQRLTEFAKQFGPLMNVKHELDKVYSNGYFENYYPDADKLLKGALHEKAMEAWTHADGFGSKTKIEPEEEHDEKEERKVVVNINLSG